VVDLALARRVFGALDGQGDAAVRAELAARILLPRREAAPLLIGLGLGRALGLHTLGDDDRELQMNDERRLPTEV